MIAAPHVDDRTAVIGERDVRELLPVVVIVGGELACREVRRIGNVDVARSPFVERPRDPVTRRRGDEIFREWIIQDLIEREVRGPLGACV